MNVVPEKESTVVISRFTHFLVHVRVLLVELHLHMIHTWRVKVSRHLIDFYAAWCNGLFFFGNV